MSNKNLTQPAEAYLKAPAVRVRSDKSHSRETTRVRSKTKREIWVKRTPRQALAQLKDTASRDWPVTVAAMDTEQLEETLDILHALMQTVINCIDVLFENLPNNAVTHAGG